MSEELAAAPEAVETTAAPTEAPVEAQAPEQTPEQTEPPQEPPKPDRIAKRFSELSQARDRAREEAEYWRQQALSTQPQHEPAQDVEADAPYSPDAIQAAVQRALAEERRQNAEREAQNARSEKVKTLQTKLLDSGLEGAVYIASGGDIPFSEAMMDALAVSEQATAIAHHLGTNPVEAARIAGLPPQLQGYELAKLESRLASQPKTTSAPPPPSTVGTRANPAPGLRDDMSPEDWRKQFIEQMRSR